MPSEVIRTAVFRLHNPTRHAAAAFERAFRDYAHAYHTLLYSAWLQYGQQDDLAHGQVTGLDALRGLATYALDTHTGQPRLSARKLSQRLFRGEDLLPRAVEALEHLPSRLRQSSREHAGQTLLGYVALADLWLTQPPAARGGPPAFPRSETAAEFTTNLDALLLDFATIADNQKREAELRTSLQSTRSPNANAIPFVGVDDNYGAGLYHRVDEHGHDHYYARLDILPPAARSAKPLTMRGVYTSLKTGDLWVSEDERQLRIAAGESVEHLHSFGRRRGLIWMPLTLDLPSGARKHEQISIYHQQSLPFTRAVFLPSQAMQAMALTPPPTTPATDAVDVSSQTEASAEPSAEPAELAGTLGSPSSPSSPLPAKPLSAILVRHQAHGARGEEITYSLNVSFALPGEALDAADTLPAERRTILAINRGLTHLYTAALLSPDGKQELASFAVSGRELLARQAALEAERRERQKRGKDAKGAGGTAARHKQRRIAAQEVNICANQIVEVARRARAGRP